MGPVVGFVRQLLHSYGVRLPNRVRVELATPAQVQQRMGAGAHGYTVTHRSEWSRAEVVELRIVDGLPATQFGQVLAHEMGHGWLAGCPDVGRSADEEEGICELLASWWLEHRGGPLAAHLLESMSSSPDPIYGEGYRGARRLAFGRAPADIVASVARTGRL